MTRVGGSIWRVQARASSQQRPILGMEYRLEYTDIGVEGNRLFAVDGAFNATVETGELYVDTSQWGPAPWPVEVRARSRDGWGAWTLVEIGEASAMAPRLTDVCTQASKQSGKDGWHRGDVTVDCAAMAKQAGVVRLEYAVGFGEWQPLDEPLVLAAEGAHWIQVRAVDAQGHGSIPESYTVSIDRSAPTVQVLPLARQTFTHAEAVRFQFYAEDALSGVDRIYATLNEDWEIIAGEPMELWQLPLGSHYMTVWAKDKAGNRAQASDYLFLEVTTDLGTLGELIQLFKARGKADGGHELVLEMQEWLAEADAAYADGDIFWGRFYLQLFVEATQDAVAQGAVYADAGRVLIGDARYLMGQENGFDGLEDSPW